jgi:tetratricopeptide (TPR) repeat protein
MPSRHLPLSLLIAAACLLSTALRAQTLAEIEKAYQAGQFEQALKMADAAVTAEPRAAPIRFYKGVMLAEQKQTQQAMQVFRALIQDHPELADPYNNLAVLYAADGQLQSALEALQAALRNDPKHRAARENLGDVHLALAQQAWAAAQAVSKGDDAELRRKLRLAREIQAAPAQAARSPG